MINFRYKSLKKLLDCTLMFYFILLKMCALSPKEASCLKTKKEETPFVLLRFLITRILMYQSEGKPVLYMDETNFNIHISRRQGRTRRGTRCTSLAAALKGANVHLIGVISPLGMIHHEIKRGRFKKEDAKNFTRHALRKAVQMRQCPVVLVIDNAPCHNSIDEVTGEEEFKTHTILRLGP